MEITCSTTLAERGGKTFFLGHSNKWHTVQITTCLWLSHTNFNLWTQPGLRLNRVRYSALAPLSNPDMFTTPNYLPSLFHSPWSMPENIRLANRTTKKWICKKQPHSMPWISDCHTTSFELSLQALKWWLYCLYKWPHCSRQSEMHQGRPPCQRAWNLHIHLRLQLHPASFTS